MLFNAQLTAKVISGWLMDTGMGIHTTNTRMETIIKGKPCNTVKQASTLAYAGTVPWLFLFGHQNAFFSFLFVFCFALWSRKAFFSFLVIKNSFYFAFSLTERMPGAEQTYSYTVRGSAVSTSAVVRQINCRHHHYRYDPNSGCYLWYSWKIKDEINIVLKYCLCSCCFLGWVMCVCVCVM